MLAPVAEVKFRHARCRVAVEIGLVDFFLPLGELIPDIPYRISLTEIDGIPWADIEPGLPDREGSEAIADPE